MSAPSIAPAVITQRCTVDVGGGECGEMITGKATGAGSVAWKMGTHRRVRHGIKGEGKSKAGRPRKGAPTAEDHEARPVFSAVQEMAAEVGGKGTPSGDALGNAIGKGIWILSGGLADILADTDPMIPAGPDYDRDREQLAERLTVPRNAAHAIGRPAGRMLATTSVNVRFGRAAVDNVDSLAAVFELVRFGAGMREYFAYRRETIALLAAQNQAMGASGIGAANGYTPPPMNPAPVMHPDATVSPGMSGVLIDATMVTPHPQTQPAGRVVGADEVAAMQSQTQNGARP